MKKLVVTAEAIFDEYRLQIIKLLQTGEMCVCELAAVLNLSSSRVSQHLSVMKRSKIVKERRDGKWIYYSLIPKTLDGFTGDWQELMTAPMDLVPGMKNCVKQLQKMDRTAVKEQCETKKVSPINKLMKEGTTNGN